MAARLAELTSAEVRAHSKAVRERLSRLREFVAAKSLLVFVSFGEEIETHELIRAALAAGPYADSQEAGLWYVGIADFEQGRYATFESGAQLRGHLASVAAKAIAGA